MSSCFALSQSQSFATTIGPRGAERASKELFHVTDVAIHVNELNVLYASLLTEMTAAIAKDDWNTITRLTSELKAIGNLKVQAIDSSVILPIRPVTSPASQIT